MLNVYKLHYSTITPLEGLPEVNTNDEAAVLWLDLAMPTEAEFQHANQWLGAELPSKATIQSIDTSRRLCHLDHLVQMTVMVLPHRFSNQIEPLSLFWSPTRLITLRFADLPAVDELIREAQSPQSEDVTSFTVLSDILDALLEHTADLLESVSKELDSLSNKVFHYADKSTVKLNTRQLQKVLKHLGRLEFTVSKLKEGILSIQRLITFLKGKAGRAALQATDREILTSLETESNALNQQAQFLMDNLTFVLDATLGFISLEQNDVIKVLTVLSVAFLPPTLIASVYGMNFQHMPELAMPQAYPLSVLAMVITGLLPVWYFRRQGWF
jgi:magnesium transporter